MSSIGLLNSVSNNGEALDRNTIDLLSNINMKANTLQNASFYAMFRSSNPAPGNQN